MACQMATYAQLVTDPFNVPMRDLARLTDWQIARLYMHPRTKEGAIVQPEAVEDRPPPERGSPEDKALWFAQCSALGLPMAYAEEEWQRKRGEAEREWHRKNGGK